MKFVKCLTVAVTAVTLGVICAVCASAATIYKSPDGNFEYTIGSDGNITIGSYIGKGGEAAVPSVYEYRLLPEGAGYRGIHGTVY